MFTSLFSRLSVFKQRKLGKKAEKKKILWIIFHNSTFCQFPWGNLLYQYQSLLSWDQDVVDEDKWPNWKPQGKAPRITVACRTCPAMKMEIIRVHYLLKTVEGAVVLLCVQVLSSPTSFPNSRSLCKINEIFCLYERRSPRLNLAFLPSQKLSIFLPKGDIWYRCSACPNDRPSFHLV